MRLRPALLVALVLVTAASGGVSEFPERPCVPMPAVEIGLASWYGSEHEGRLTASGEVFRMARLTAAHPELPLGSRARVLNLRTGLSVQVRVNDRGPFIAGRGIDLSREAARRIGMLDAGVDPVEIQVVR